MQCILATLKHLNVRYNFNGTFHLTATDKVKDMNIFYT